MRRAYPSLLEGTNITLSKSALLVKFIFESWASQGAGWLTTKAFPAALSISRISNVVASINPLGSVLIENVRLLPRTSQGSTPRNTKLPKSYCTKIREDAKVQTKDFPRIVGVSRNFLISTIRRILPQGFSKLCWISREGSFRAFRLLLSFSAIDFPTFFNPSISQ